MAVSKSTGKRRSGTTQTTKQIIIGKRARDRRPQRQISQDALDSHRIENDGPPQIHRNEPPRLGLNFTEVVGKVIAFVNVINDPPNWQALEIRFTDRTLLHFELGSAPPQITPTYMEARHGNLELIRSYGTLLSEDERRACDRATGGDNLSYDL